MEKQDDVVSVDATPIDEQEGDLDDDTIEVDLDVLVESLMSLMLEFKARLERVESELHLS